MLQQGDTDSTLLERTKANLKKEWQFGLNLWYNLGSHSGDILTALPLW